MGKEQEEKQPFGSQALNESRNKASLGWEEWEVFGVQIQVSQGTDDLNETLNDSKMWVVYF